ncbi:MAG: hypothetical protein ACRDH6_08780 [Actinomycetota bacterium]
MEGKPNARQRPRMLLCAVSLSVALLAAACSSSGGAPDTEPGEPGKGVPDAFAAELQALGERWAETTATISYQFETIGGGSGGAQDSGTLVLSWLPPSDSRMDLESETGARITVITGEEFAFLCAPEGGGSCVVYDRTGEASPVAFAGFFSKPEAVAEQIEKQVGELSIRRSERTLADLRAICFSLASDPDVMVREAEWCFSPQGILLRFQTTSTVEGKDAAIVFRATSVVQSVDEAVFEPPYPVIEPEPTSSP